MRDEQVERLEVAAPRRGLQDAARVRAQLESSDVADTWADTWAKVGVCAYLEEIGDEGWVAGNKA